MSGSEHLTKWTSKVCPGGVLLVLEHTPHNGEPPAIVSSWTREDVTALREQGVGIGQEIAEAAEDHADAIGDSCSFKLQWRRDNGEVIRSTVYHSAGKERPTSSAARTHSGDVLLKIIDDLLGHIEKQQRTFNGGLGATLAAFERALSMQDKMLERAAQLAPEKPEPTELDETLTALKISAFEKLCEIGPEVIRVGLAAMGKLEAPASVLAQSNGQAGEITHVA